MDRCVGAAALLAESDRMDLAIQALARSATISDLSVRHGVSRKFIYQQTDKARTALDDALLPTAPDDEVLFQVAVTKTWLRQVIVGLTLICRGSYRGVVEFLRDLLGVSISIGTVHHVLEWAAQQAGIINHDQDLSGIRVGLHDELFQGAMPVLAGVDAASTIAISWLWRSIAMPIRGACICSTPPSRGCGLTIRSPMPGKVCVPDRRPLGTTRPAMPVFHIQHQCEGLANTLSRLAKGAKSRREKLEARIDRAGQPGPDDELAIRLELARQTEAQADCLARDIRLLTQWLSHDVLALAGPTLVTRQMLFDFVVAELQRREPEDTRRIRPVRVALQNQRDDLLAFAGVLDEKLAAIAQVHDISALLVREACVLHRLPSTSTAYWQEWNRLRATLGGKFHAALDAVSGAMAGTPRGSSLVENLNSRLRTYFTLRRHLGGSYLDLLQFFLNHRCFMRSRCAERNGKSPRELMTGHGHPHWLTLLGLGPLQPKQA
jgi:hypothetical protein